MHTEITQCLDKLRAHSPLIHNITNDVVTNTTANALLAIGASPVMAHAPDEVSDMVAIADSLVINTGTITRPRLDSMISAALTANRLNKRWILDPVGAGATPFRLEANLQLLALQPTAIRGNASEILTLCTGEPCGKGVDSSHSSEATLRFLHEKAKEINTVISVTGQTDIVTNGKQLVRLNNGHPMMATVTGTGCTATAIIGAFLAICSPWQASIAGLSILGVAGELAAKISKGPGSLQMNLLDTLYQLSAPQLEQHLKIEVSSL